MTVSVDNVTVLGTGNLGSQIAYQTAYSGFEVMAYDINDQILETARRRFEELAARYEQDYNIAEIMAHSRTDPAIYYAVVDFARRIGMEPIKIHKEKAGYVQNSLLVPFLEAAQALIVNGIADPETIDKTWRIATGAPKGPLQMLDIIGLTTAYHIAASGDEQARANARYLKEHYIDQGKLGRASGEGFYKYETAPTQSSRSQVTASA